MKRIAIYPGSFNPFTVGHQNILEKTEKLFDEVIVSVGMNMAKVPKSVKEEGGDVQEYMQNAVDSKVETLKKQLPSKNVQGYIGFLTDFVRSKQEEGYDEVIVVRGLRNGYDFDYEYNQTRHMWDQFPSMSIINIFCDPIFSHVSSSAYRDLESVRKGAGHHLLAKDRLNPLIKRGDVVDDDGEIRI